MKLFGENPTLAKSRFWFFMSRLRRCKKANGEVLAVNKDVCWIEQFDNDDFGGTHVWFLEDTPTIWGPGSYGGISIQRSAQVGCQAGANTYPTQVMNGWSNGGNSMKVHSTSDWQEYSVFNDGESWTKPWPDYPDGACVTDPSHANIAELSMGGLKDHRAKKKEALKDVAE